MRQSRHQTGPISYPHEHTTAGLLTVTSTTQINTSGFREAVGTGVVSNGRQEMPCFSSGAGTRTRLRGPVRSPALTRREVYPRETGSDPVFAMAAKPVFVSADLLAHELRALAARLRVSGYQNMTTTAVGGSGGSSAQKASATCLPATRSPATSKRTGLSLAWASRRARPRSPH